MSITNIKDIFLDSELYIFNNIISNHSSTNDESINSFLGRFEIREGFIPMPINTTEKLLALASDFFDCAYSLSSVVYVEYSNAYGTPSLPPHFDEDQNDLIINYQLSSNTSWGVGVGSNLYSLDDNSALLFNPNTNIHWRPQKTFKDGEYVRMIFFRFCKKETRSQYPVLTDKVKNELFGEIYDIMGVPRP